MEPSSCILNINNKLDNRGPPNLSSKELQHLQWSKLSTMHIKCNYSPIDGVTCLRKRDLRRKPEERRLRSFFANSPFVIFVALVSQLGNLRFSLPMLFHRVEGTTRKGDRHSACSARRRSSCPMSYLFVRSRAACTWRYTTSVYCTTSRVTRGGTCTTNQWQTRWRSAWCSGSRAVHRTTSTCVTRVRCSEDLTTAGRSMERAFSTTTRRRGHQHHPRHTTRRRLDASSRGPAQCGPAGTKDTTASAGDETSLERTAVDAIESRLGTTDLCLSAAPKTLGPRWSTRINEIETKNSKTHAIVGDDGRKENVRQRLAQCSLDVPAPGESKDAERDETTNDLTSKKLSLRSSPRGSSTPDEETSPRSKPSSPEPEHAVARARGDGNSDDESNVEEDPELAELAKLRCPSERTEIQAEREARRRKRCADYPGLAFGCSIFSSDTMMKFSLIKNELQNIMGNQLKRVSIAV